jgi:hypothetical protein
MAQIRQKNAKKIKPAKKIKSSSGRIAYCQKAGKWALAHLAPKEYSPSGAQGLTHRQGNGYGVATKAGRGSGAVGRG